MVVGALGVMYIAFWTIKQMPIQLEEKAKQNLSHEEKQMLKAAYYSFFSLISRIFAHSAYFTVSP